MTNTPIYDGSGKLSEAIAELCKTSPKSSQLIAKLIGQAKAGLGIASKSKNPTTDVKLAIWQSGSGIMTVCTQQLIIL